MIENVWKTFALVGFAIIKMRALLYIAFIKPLSGWLAACVGGWCWTWSPALWCPNVWDYQNFLETLLLFLGSVALG